MPGTIEQMKPHRTLTQGGIIDGDIVCFQIDIPDQEIRNLESSGLCSNAQQFYGRLQK